MTKYRCISADPPWAFGRGWGWGARDYYQTMAKTDIGKIWPSLEPLVDDNAHLWLWSPNGMLTAALAVMNAWGFEHKTTLTWAKTRSIFGYYLKGQTELCLFGVRGKLPPMDRHQTTLVTAPNGRHSEKPQAAFDVFEKVSPGPRLELFGRVPRAGWDVLGDGLSGKPILEELAELEAGTWEQGVSK